MYLVVPPVALPEAEDQAFEHEFSDLGELGVDNGNHGRVHVGEDGGGTLGLEHGAGQETPEQNTHVTLHYTRNTHDQN